MTQKQFLCIQRSSNAQSCNTESLSPAQMEEMFAKFTAWQEKFKDNIVNMGGKLSSDGKVVSSQGNTDGPFVEAKEIVGGYMIISAESLEAAVKVIQEGPGIGDPGSTIEIREIDTP